MQPLGVRESGLAVLHVRLGKMCQEHLWQCRAVHPLINMWPVQLCHPAEHSDLSNILLWYGSQPVSFCAHGLTYNPLSPEAVPTWVVASSRKQRDRQLLAGPGRRQPRRCGSLRQQRQEGNPAAAIIALYLTALDLRVRHHACQSALSRI